MNSKLFIIAGLALLVLAANGEADAGRYDDGMSLASVVQAAKDFCFPCPW